MEVIRGLLQRANLSLDRDIQIHNDEAYGRIIRDGTLGLGESYMEGMWDAPHLDDVFYKICRANITSKDISWTARLYLVWGWLSQRLFNPQSVSGSRKVGEQHYDLGNDFYAQMLDARMIYSCAYWQSITSTGTPAATNLDEAQTNKCRLICEKLKLQPGMTVLDIGFGWGGLARFMVEHYRVRVVGVTISKEQYEYAKVHNASPEIDYRLCDYRQLGDDQRETFDRVVSVGMFEHVGSANYAEFFQIVHRVLKPDGIFLLHTIAGNSDGSVGDPWMTKYIFPNSMLPTIRQIVSYGSNGGLFTIEDVHNFGTDYDRTLMAWFERFDRTFTGDKNGTFYRMWKYYLLMSAGGFRGRALQLYQIVMTKKRSGGYVSVR